MSENAIFALIPILGISIPIFGILLTGFRRWADLKEKQLQNTASATAEQAAQYAGRIAVLEERVAVLERIATDKPSMLAAEIDGLKTKQLN
jgi:uncharacterized BrkB/YihY/UPF0761 family membrane protein